MNDERDNDHTRFRRRISDPWFDDDCRVAKRCVRLFEREAHRVRRIGTIQTTSKLSQRQPKRGTRGVVSTDGLSMKSVMRFGGRRSTLNVLAHVSYGALSAHLWAVVVLPCLLSTPMRHIGSLTTKWRVFAPRLTMRRHLLTRLHRRPVNLTTCADCRRMTSSPRCDYCQTNSVSQM